MNGCDACTVETLSLMVPHKGTGDAATPAPSVDRAAALGVELAEASDLHLQATSISTLRLPAAFAVPFLATLDANHHAHDAIIGHDLTFWGAVARFALELIIDQRFVPSISQTEGGPLRGGWVPWLADSELAERLALLVKAAPPVVFAAVDVAKQDPWSTLENALESMVDSSIRKVLEAEEYIEAIEDRDASSDRHVAWLSGLLATNDTIALSRENSVELLRGARLWLGGLQDPNDGRAVKLCLQLHEPLEGFSGDEAPPTKTAQWPLTFHLVVTDDPPIVIDAEQIWADGGSGRLVDIIGAEETPGDVLLGELARVERIWPRMTTALEQADPMGLDLSTAEAHAFLREIRPILQEAGIDVLVPSWWGTAASRIGVRMLVEPTTTLEGAASDTGPLGLANLVRYAWEISIGQETVGLEELRRLAESGSPLVRIGDQWIELQGDDFERAKKFLERHPGGEMTLGEAMRLAAVGDEDSGSLAISGIRCEGWIKELFGEDEGEGTIDVLQPKAFRGTLRPYQLRGLSWLVFLDRLGLGGCLADDMGLGKTIQLIALLQHERTDAKRLIGPTLLVCPMSVMGNWKRELERFSPELNVEIQHGPDRAMDDALWRKTQECDVIITTYALVSRDLETLGKIEWERVVLDEAQHIKNPPTKQASAIRTLKARHRIALTGTPVENRLTELWSILEFCLPGFLGTQGDFHRRFAVPIERHGDEEQVDRLRKLVGPFVLRRLKTDPGVADDLPPLVEMKTRVPLTSEQARLYDSVVEDMLKKVDEATGMRRRGLVLSGLVKLKQVCNHPAHFLRQTDVVETGGTRLSQRSGKTIRLIEMLEETIAAGDQSLLFTQYRQMGHLLATILRQELDIEPLFLHGGTPQAKRQEMIDRFQNEKTIPVFILSLKAGGVGVNLTAANHVFHFDRWWNPAVENQATDRAFRIGQTRTVYVHKMMTTGTLEERIDQMIEQKKDLAKRVIGTGEGWLTELSSSQLRDVLALRENLVEEAAS